MGFIQKLRVCDMDFISPDDLITYDILWWYDIHVTHTKFLDKIRNLLVLLNPPKTEYGARNILKYASDVP